MSINVTGVIERKGIGPGTWALVADSGETYELKDAPAELKKSELKVKVEGQVRDDVMTFAMIGPVLEVKSFEVLE
jgi:sarcosine oxidase gamma subunit